MTKSKIKDGDYLYLSALLRARETKMLTRDRMSRMIDAGSFGEAAKALSECGYEDMSKMKAAEIEKALSDHMAAVFSDMEPLLPEKGILDAFRMKYDYHNAKVLIKAESTGLDGARLLSRLGRISAKELSDSYVSENKHDIPGRLKEAIFEARGVLMRTESPKLSDFVLDKGYFAEMLEVASSLSTPFMLEYVKLQIDGVNLGAIVRTKRMGGKLALLKGAIISDGNVNAFEVLDGLMSGGSLSQLYHGSEYEHSAELGEKAVAGGSLTEFELSCKAVIQRYIDKSRNLSFGATPVIGYIASVENEVSAARIILTGKLSGLKPALIRERLSDLNA